MTSIIRFELLPVIGHASTSFPSRLLKLTGAISLSFPGLVPANHRKHAHIIKVLEAGTPNPARTGARSNFARRKRLKIGRAQGEERPLSSRREWRPNAPSVGARRAPDWAPGFAGASSTAESAAPDGEAKLDSARMDGNSRNAGRAMLNDHRSRNARFIIGRFDRKPRLFMTRFNSTTGANATPGSDKADRANLQTGLGRFFCPNWNRYCLYSGDMIAAASTNPLFKREVFSSANARLSCGSDTGGGFFRIGIVGGRASLEAYDDASPTAKPEGCCRQPVSRRGDADRRKPCGVRFWHVQGDATMEFILEGDPEANTGSTWRWDRTRGAISAMTVVDTGQLGFTQTRVLDYTFNPGVPRRNKRLMSSMSGTQQIDR